MLLTFGGLDYADDGVREPLERLEDREGVGEAASGVDGLHWEFEKLARRVIFTLGGGEWCGVTRTACFRK